MATKQRDTWSPYGLEAIRAAHLRRRRLLSLLVAIGLAGLWLLMIQLSTVEERSLEITDSSGNKIEIDVSDSERPREDGPLTISLSPGRVTRAETGGTAAADSSVTRFAAPTFERASPISWGGYALMYGPFVLLGLALWLLGKRRPKAEVNYGIYKGAMPLEMMTASAARHVFTTREARRSLFGKRRGDYLPPEIVRVERMAAEDET